MQAANPVEAYAREFFRPPDKVPVSQWAAKFFHVDKTSPAPGLYDPTTTPWINQILDDYPDPNLTQIVIRASAQSSKTQPAIICLAWVIANDPGPAMWVTAAGDEVKTFAKTRLRDSFENTPPVSSLLDGLGRSDDNLTEINFRTMPLILNGANSPTKLQSKPERYLFLDEVRDWPEGALEMVEKRTTFWLGLHKVLIFSTPQTKGDAFDSRFLAGDQREYHVGCPGCWIRGPLVWDHLKWDTNEHTRPGGVYHFPRLFETIRYEFPCCGFAIKDDQPARVKLAREGVWVPTNHNAAPGKRSYAWNALLVPRIPFSLLVEEFLKAKQAYKDGVFQPLQDFVNQRLAKVWDEGQLVNWSKPVHVFAPTDGQVKEGALFRFMTVDVQIDHFFFVIRDWWEDGASRLVTYGKLSSWTEIRAKQLEKEVLENLTFIDCGYEITEVYRHCAHYGWCALRGEDKDYYLHPSPEEKGRPVRRLYSQLGRGDAGRGSSSAGTMIAAFFNWSNPGIKDILKRLRDGKGARWELPEGIEEEVCDEPNKRYIAQIYSETKRGVRNKQTGRVVYRWQQIGSRPNHYWDCECMQVVAACMAGVVVTNLELKAAQDKAEDSPEEVAET